MDKPANTGLTTLTDTETDQVNGGSHTNQTPNNGAVHFDRDGDGGRPSTITTPNGNVVFPGQGQFTQQRQT